MQLTSHKANFSNTKEYGFAYVAEYWRNSTPLKETKTKQKMVPMARVELARA
ncbi:MAG: hypothetical protein PSN36_03600 [Gammaproteobacteria bacterium]|nr:hypothetical protein [Gammaproteobacteria bacterium]